MLPVHIQKAFAGQPLETLQSSLTDVQCETGDATIVRDLGAALLANPVFWMSFHPRRMSPADLIRVLDCLELEMSPSAILETPDRDGLRADVGVLVCLYGECTVELDAGYGPLSIQMAASDVLICPSSVPLSVLSGDLAWLARFWAQSHVRSPAIREVLHDLATASAFADILGGEDHEGKQALRACYHDVLAMYAET